MNKKEPQQQVFPFGEGVNNAPKPKEQNEFVPTQLDKAVEFTDPHWTRHRYRQENKILPFQDYYVRNDFESAKNREKLKTEAPKEKLNLNFPDISPENINYRKLTDKEHQNLLDSDNEEYKRHIERSKWNSWRPAEEFEPRYKENYELNKSLPEDVKRKIVDRYNEFKVVAVEFKKRYDEAIEAASQDVKLDYSGTYFDLFRRFPIFLKGKVSQELGELFGFGAPRKRGAESEYVNNLARNLNAGLRIFNINPNNFRQKIQEMDSIQYAMQNIIAAYDKRAKILKEFPKIEQEVKSFLLKKETREFLKQMDEHFPKDKKDFIIDLVNKIISGSSTYNSGELFKLDSLKESMTKKYIVENLKNTTTRGLVKNLQANVECSVKADLQEIFDKKFETKLNSLLSQLKPMVKGPNSKPKDMYSYNRESEYEPLQNLDALVKLLYKSYRIDLKSIFNFTDIFIKKDSERKEKDIGEKYDAKKHFAENSEIFRRSFMNDLYEEVEKKATDYHNKRNYVDYSIEEFLNNHKKNPGGNIINLKSLADLSEKDVNEFIDKSIRALIIKCIPNFGRNNSAYLFPSFKGVSALIQNSGKFSIDAFVNDASTAVPFIPKDFLLNLIRSLMKVQVSQHNDEISFLTAFEAVADLKKTQLPAKIFMNLLEKSGKLNPNSFTNEFMKSFKNITDSYNNFKRQIHTKMTDDEVVKMFSFIYKNVDTVQRDYENSVFVFNMLHNNAGNLTAKDVIVLMGNKNFAQYQKAGIVKQVYKAFAVIRNFGGLKGLYEKYGSVIEDMKKGGFVSKAFDRNVRLISKVFLSNEVISPAMPMFKELFNAAATFETDVQVIEMSEAIKELTTNYDKKDLNVFKLDMSIKDNLRFRVLKDKDPRTLRVGLETGCCQRLGGVGEVAARDSFVNPLAGVLILEHKNGGTWELLSQSYFHYVPKDNSFILDNVEDNFSAVKESEVDLEAAYAFLAKNVKDKLDVKYFLAGKGYSDIETSVFSTESLKGGDPRFFSEKSFTKDRRTPYTDFKANNAINLLAPKGIMENRINSLLEDKEIKQAFEVVLMRIIKTSMVSV